jgi:hypothetical protein
MIRFAFLLAALPLLANDAGQTKITYSKSFPGSTPAFVWIGLDKSGRAEYKEAAGDEQPVQFQLNPEETTAIFGLAEKLGHFKRPLESGLKVANMGMKTFRFENGKEQYETKFNYTQDLDAQALTDWFERMTETQQHLAALERTVRFDKLGVNTALLQLHASLERNRLIAPDQFLKLLDRVAKNESYLHMARERAAGLAKTIRDGKPKAE